VQLDLNELRDLLMSLRQTDISELTLKADDFELVVKRDSFTNASPALTSPGLLPNQNLSGGMPSVQTDTPISLASNQPPVPPKPSQSDTNVVEIKSPMVGTFYRAPAPDEDPFVTVGDRIRVGQTVCILEAMKLMNELEAEVSGEIVEILAENGQPVEFDQVLMRVIPD
jgi:acetyl-CoA carboxylase biotin carboxyl carrier protein